VFLRFRRLQSEQLHNRPDGCVSWCGESNTMELWLVRTTDRPRGPRWDGSPEMCRQTASSSISRSTDSTRRYPELLWATSLRQTYVSSKQIWHTLRDVGPGGWGLDPLKYVRWVGVCFDHLKCHIFHSKLLFDVTAERLVLGHHQV